MIRTVEINNSNANDEELKKLYESSFSDGESVPYDDLIKGIKLLDIDYTAYYEGDKLIGLSLITRMQRYNWGAYFAVPKELRGKGLGKKILSIVLDKYKKEKNPFIVDAESPLQTDAPNLEARKRHHSFYLRNGFRDTGIYYSFNGVSFSVLSTSEEPFTQKDFDEIATALQPALEEMKMSNKQK